MKQLERPTGHHLLNYYNHKQTRTLNGVVQRNNYRHIVSAKSCVWSVTLVPACFRLQTMTKKLPKLWPSVYVEFASPIKYVWIKRLRAPR